MKRFITLFATMLWVQILTFSQSNSEPAKFDYLIIFNNDEEKEAWKAINDSISTNELIKLLLNVEPGQKSVSSDEVNYRLNSFYESLSDLNIQQKDIKKQVRLIYKNVHDSFLFRYDEEANFGNLWEDGSYNCLSASTLYAIMLSHYSISYAIKLTDLHVYIIADPGQNDIIIETTDSKGGYRTLKNADLTRYKNELSRYKIIPPNELEALDDKKLRNELTNFDQSISLTELISLYYYNSGVSKFDNEQTDIAVSQLAKCLTLFNYSEAKYFLTMALSTKLIDSDYKKVEKVPFYLSLLNVLELKGNFYVDYFKELTNKYMVFDTDTATFIKICNIFNNFINDTLVKTEIDFQFNLTMGAFYLISSNLDQGIDHLLKAYALNKNNLKLHQILKDAFSDKLLTFDSKQEYLTSLDSIEETYPFLKDSELLINSRLKAYLYLAIDFFSIDQRENALEYLDKFESTFKPENKAKINTDFIAYSYYAGWSSYARARDADKAKQMISRGKKFAPFNQDLNRAEKYTTY